MNKGVFFTALSALLYGSIGYFGSRLIGLGVPVTDLLFWRFLFACLFLQPVLPMILKKQKGLVQLGSLWSLFIFGALFYGMGTALYFEASKSIGTGLAMVIFFTYPIFVVALSYFLRSIKVSFITLGCLVLIMLGCGMIAFGGNDGIDLDLWGVVLAVLSGLCYGAYVFFSKEASNKLSPVLSTLSVCLGATSAFAFYALCTTQTLYWPQSLEVWLLIGLFALFGTVLPVLLLLIGMGYLSASTASVISVLEPVAVLGVGALVLDEPLGPLQFLGALIILCATILVQVKPRHKSSTLEDKTA